MKIINLDIVKSQDVFLLGSNEYRYLGNENDKKFYLESLLKLDSKKNNTEDLKKIFKRILEKQNIIVDIQNNDVFGLFQYFNSKYL